MVVLSPIEEGVVAAAGVLEVIEVEAPISVEGPIGF
jgi:hypothetical protein